MKKLMIFLVFCTSLLGACQKSNNLNYTPDCSGPAKSFSNDVLPVIQNSCYGCHPNFDSYSSIKANKSSIRSAVADGMMPPEGSLSDTQKNKIVCWIDNGAPNN
jgi:hypothetical protein